LQGRIETARVTLHICHRPPFFRCHSGFLILLFPLSLHLPSLLLLDPFQKLVASLAGSPFRPARRFLLMFSPSTLTVAQKKESRPIRLLGTEQQTKKGSFGIVMGKPIIVTARFPDAQDEGK
jgi:hypothetical protein